jgi:AcrR family transcriptional regulator
VTVQAVPRSTHERVVAAARRCLADQGLKGTTVDDVAGAAGVSRATLYRAFPGGRETIVAAVVDAERTAMLEVVAAAVAGADDLRGALVAGLSSAARWLSSHEVLERLMFEEPAVVLTHVEFEQMDRTLGFVCEQVAPLLEGFLSADVAERVAEWGARLVVSYLLFPCDDLDITTPEGAARIVDRHVLPGVLALAAGQVVPT